MRRFFSDESGLETVEYAVFGALLMAAGVLGGQALWTAVQTKFTSIATWINSPS